MNPDMMMYTSAGLWGVSIASLSFLVLTGVSKLKFEQRTYKVQVPLFFKLFLPYARHFHGIVRRKGFRRTLENTETKLVQAGLDQEFTAEDFVALRIMYLFFFCTVGLVLVFTRNQALALIGLGCLFMGLIYPVLWLGSIIRKRHRAIQRALPNVLDLLTLSVEAGRDFLSALREILQHRPKDPLGEELERVFREVQLGKQRRQALKAMAERVRQADLASVVETLVQADELGVSIGQILRILSDQMRQKRFAHAEKLANESPVKLLFPLFLFIFPAVIIVMLGPVLLRAFAGFAP